MPNFDWKEGETQFLHIGNTKLEAVCFGPSPVEKPTLVLLHEGLGCISLWKSFPQRLAEKTGFGVFAYSRSGYGKSTPAQLPRRLDYMTQEAVDVLPEVLGAIAFQRGVLLGHSDGATIASIYAGSIEDHRIRGLIVMAPHFFGEPESWKSIAEAKHAFEAGDLRQKLARHHDNPDNAFRGWNDAWLDPGFREWNVADVIDYFRIPVLAIQGKDDQYGTLAQIDEIENRIYSPLDTAILEGCGHSPHLEKPEETLSAIRTFIERLQRIEAEVVKLHAM